MRNDNCCSLFCMSSLIRLYTKYQPRYRRIKPPKVKISL